MCQVRYNEEVKQKYIKKEKKRKFIIPRSRLVTNVDRRPMGSLETTACLTSV